MGGGGNSESSFVHLTDAPGIDGMLIMYEIPLKLSVYLA